MFRGKSTIKRMNAVVKVALESGNAKLPLSKQELMLIEGTRLLDAGEKIELILTSMGYRLTCEVYSTIGQRFDKTLGREAPHRPDIDRLRNLLTQLPFPFFLDSVQRTNKETGVVREIAWFQVCVNKRVRYLMQYHGDELTEIELGVIYGYPLSAIRAYAHLIDDCTSGQKESLQKYFVGAGVPSQEFIQEEENYYHQVWDSLTRLSPKIAQEARESFSSS